MALSEDKAILLVEQVAEKVDQVSQTVDQVAQTVGQLQKDALVFQDVRNDISESEALSSQTVFHNARNFDNAKMIAADEKNNALEREKLAIEKERLAVRRESIALDQNEALKNAYLITLADERIAKARNWSQELRHGDIAIENQWPDGGDDALEE